MGVLKKFLSFSVGTWIGAVLGAIAIPVMTHFFTPEEFGKASMFTLALNMLMFLSLFGVDQSFVRFFYEENIKALLSSCIRIIFFVFVLVTSLLFIFRNELSFYLFDEYNPSVIFQLWLCILFYIIIRFGELMFRMNQNGKLYSLNQISLRLFDLIFVILFFYVLDDSYVTIVFAKTITFLTISLFILFYYFKVWKSLFKKGINSIGISKDILKYSYPLAITGLITWIFQSVDRFAIKEWSSMSDLGIYVVAFRVVSVLTIIQASFCTYWTPLSLEKFIHEGESQKNKDFFKKICGIMSLVMLSVALFMIIFKNLIPIVLGNQYSYCVNIIPFLVFMPVMYTLSEVTSLGIVFFKKPKVLLWISTFVCLFNIIGNIILVPKFGSLGAAISTSLSYIIFFALRTYFSLRLYSIDYGINKLVLIISLIFFYAVYSSFNSWSFIDLFIGVLLLCLLFLLYKEYLIFSVIYIRDRINLKKC